MTHYFDEEESLHRQEKRMSTQTPQTVITEEHLAQALCVYKGLALIGADGSPEWWLFADTARKMIANADGSVEVSRDHYKALCE
jgi:hypothetical protein